MTAPFIAAALSLTVMIASGSPVSTTGVAVNVLTFSGSLHGRARVQRDGCLQSRPRGVILEFDEHLRGWTASAWTLQAVAPHNGTFRLPDGENAGVILTSSPLFHVWGMNSSGSFSVEGRSGDLHVTLWDMNGQKVEIDGSWACR